MVQQPLQWVKGEGWFGLLGGGDWQRGETDRVDAQILSLSNLDRPMMVLLGEGTQEEADGLLEHYTLLGGPGGEAFVLSQMTRRHLADPHLLNLLAEAGLLYLAGENPLPFVTLLRDTPAWELILKGFTTYQGLMIIGAAGGAAALGAWVIGPAPQSRELPGLGLITNTIIGPHFRSLQEAGELRQFVQRHPESLGLGIPDGTALALGPQGQVETWGAGQVTAVVHLAGSGEA